MTGSPSREGGQDAAAFGTSRSFDALALAAVLAVVGLAAWKVSAGLNPPSLFLDDQWVGIALERMSVAERFTHHLPMPLAWGVLEGLPGLVVDDPELSLQIVPALAYLASIPLFAALLRRLTGSGWAAVLGAAVIAASPLAADLAVRAKHYTTDQLVTVVALLAAARLFGPGRAVTPRRFLPVVAILMVGFVFSFVSVFLGTAVVLVALASAWRSEGLSGSERRNVALLAGGYVAVVAASYLIDLRFTSRPIMVQYWAPYFPDFSSWTTVRFFLTERLHVFFAQALPDGLGAALLLLPVGLVYLGRAGRVRFAATLALFYVAVLGAAAAGTYPLGTGRTDAFAVGVTALLVSLGVVEIAGRVSGERYRRAVLGGAAAAFVLMEATGRGAAYLPPAADAAVVAWTEEWLRPGDALVLGPYGVYALAYYTESRMAVVPAQYYGHGFDLEPERPRTLKSFIGRWGLTDQAALQAEVDRLVTFLAEGHERVLYVETRSSLGARNAVLGIIAQGGYRLVDQTGFGAEAEGFLFVRDDG